MLVIPDIKKNILSKRKLTNDNSCIIEFSSKIFVIKDQQGKILGKGHKKRGLYALDGSTEQAFMAIAINKAPFSIWHQQMGHPHLRFLKYLQEKHFIDIFSWIKS